MKRYGIIRLLGNDIPPRHTENQTYENTKFILENEKIDAYSMFVLNRIVDPAKYVALKTLLKKHEVEVIDIPFLRDDYRRLITDLDRLHYIIPVNRARNRAIYLGLGRAEYAVVLDGNCMFTPGGWESFDQNIRINPKDAFYILPMWRVGHGQNVLTDQPVTKEIYHFGKTELVGFTEPQIVFTGKSDALFNENLSYGQVDKVELLWRLGVPGPWDRWEPDIRRESLKNVSEHYGKCKMFSHVCRLPSGVPDCDQSNAVRGQLRFDGVCRLLQQANKLCGV